MVTISTAMTTIDAARKAVGKRGTRPVSAYSTSRGIERSRATTATTSPSRPWKASGRSCRISWKISDRIL